MEDEVFRNALPAGHVIEGYQFQSVLGAGGFGITYLATELSIDRKVAIKEFFPSGIAVRDATSQSVHPDSDRNADDFEYGLRRFADEAKTLVTLEHPNIVPVLRFFEANGSAYMAMAHQDGMSLAELLRRRGTLEEPETLAILDPLLDGLAAVHDAGFTHRDVKPANIMIRVNGQPVLIDFGSARIALGDRTRTILFSVGYAPPEQYDSQSDQQAWTDIYAVSAVVYRCLTGTTPHDAMARTAARMRNLPDPMMPFATAAKHPVSPALDAAVTAGMAVIESGRPQSVEAFRTLLAPAWAALDPAEPAPDRSPQPDMERTINSNTSPHPPESPLAPEPRESKPEGRIEQGAAEFRPSPPVKGGRTRPPDVLRPVPRKKTLRAQRMLIAYFTGAAIFVTLFGTIMSQQSVTDRAAAERVRQAEVGRARQAERNRQLDEAAKTFPAKGHCVAMQVRFAPKDKLTASVTARIEWLADGTAGLRILTLNAAGTAELKSSNGSIFKAGEFFSLRAKNLKLQYFKICPS